MLTNDPNFRRKGSSAQKQIGLLGVIFKLLPFFALKPRRHSSTCCTQLLQGAAERKSCGFAAKHSAAAPWGGREESGQSPPNPADGCEILALRPPKGFGLLTRTLTREFSAQTDSPPTSSTQTLPKQQERSPQSYLLPTCGSAGGRAQLCRAQSISTARQQPYDPADKVQHTGEAAAASGTLSPPWRGGLGSGPPWGLGNEKQPTPCRALPFDYPGRGGSRTNLLHPPASFIPPAPVLVAWGGNESTMGPRTVPAHPRCCRHPCFLQASSRGLPKGWTLCNPPLCWGWKWVVWDWGKDWDGWPQVPPARGDSPRVPTGTFVAFQHSNEGSLNTSLWRKVGFGSSLSFLLIKPVLPMFPRSHQAHGTATHSTPITPACDKGAKGKLISVEDSA